MTENQIKRLHELAAYARVERDKQDTKDGKDIFTNILAWVIFDRRGRVVHDPKFRSGARQVWAVHIHSRYQYGLVHLWVCSSVSNSPSGPFDFS